jgi:uncharacterized protein (DUF488 family)
MQPALFTFGYEGLGIDAFVERLRAERVDTVVDVRELPLSRKKGFSKTGFQNILASHGIGYVHLSALGCPKSVRNQYKLDGDWRTYTHGFLAHLERQGPVLQDLVQTAHASRACLVCFEADFSRCHRTFVARAARELGGPTIMHLTATKVLPDLV